MTFDPNDLNLDFEETEPFNLTMEMALAGAVICMSCTIEDALGIKHPAVVFRFQDANGQFHPAITLVMDPAAMLRLRSVVGDAAEAAVRKADQ